MIGTMVSRYRILERIGGGGMGVVYRAEDVSLSREVALKFLAPAMASDLDARRRFLTEARAASAVQHENVCTIHEIGETKEGDLFIVMDFCEGESLREALRRGPLPVREAALISLGAARALEAAHGQGVVHRDVKPGNVMLGTGGRIRVVDFGLARLAEASALTRSGLTAGTLSYMSPEQVKGSKVDGRTDIWSLGVLLYESIAGVPPFHSRNEQSTLLAILRDDPPPLAAGRVGLSESLARIVDKALDKDPSRRFETMGDMAKALEAALQEIDAGVARPARIPVLRMTRRKARFCLLILGGLALAGGALYGLVSAASRLGAPMVEIPAFRSQPEDEVFAVIFRDNLAAELVSLGDIRVLTSSPGKNMRYRLEGSLIRAGGRLMVTARLSNQPSGESLWAETFNRPAAEAAAVQSRIAAEVARAANIKLGAVRRVVAPGFAEHDAGVRALLAQAEASAARGTPRGDMAALEAASKALALVPADPGLAAEVALRRWIASASWRALLPPSEAARAEAEARAAISGGGAYLATPRLVLAAAARDLRGDLESSRRYLDEAAALLDHPSIPLERAILSLAHGDPLEAVIYAEEALHKAPSSLESAALRIHVLVVAGKFEDAALGIRGFRDFSPASPVADYLEGLLAAAKGDYVQAAVSYGRSVEPLGNPPLVIGRLAWARGMSGDGEAALETAALLPAEEEWVLPRAFVALGLGDETTALGLLREAARRREPQVAELLYAPEWAGARAGGLVKKALSEAWAESGKAP